MEEKTPGRGRSRFSKALPGVPKPLEHLPYNLVEGDKSPASTLTSLSTSFHSPLPPLPKETMSTMAIPRRPVGGSTIHSKLPSVDSISSSVYSDSPGFSRSLSNSSRRTKDSLSGLDSEPASTPPLPPKDEQRPQPPKTPQHILASPATSFPSSPPRPEIWRRRSLKSDKSISVPELKLDKSNGSTASPPQKVAVERSLPAVPSQLPRSITGRKPVPIPARVAPPQPDFMGSKLSKLKVKETRSLDETNVYEAPTQQHPSFTRLPTPEYLKTDKQQPLTPQVLSPVSPETPPNENVPQVPLKSESRSTFNGGPLANTTNRPNLLSTQSEHSRESSETLTIKSEPPIMQSPQPKKAFAARILTPQPSPSLSSPTSPLDLPSPLHAAAHFPKLSSLAPKGTIFTPPALDIVQMECYQAHRFMRSSRNTLCPVSCMLCQRQDSEKRWRCTWCNVAACGSCMEVLVSIPGRSIETCLERIRKQH